MYVAPRDIKILCSDEIFELYEAYKQKFWEEFIDFNYIDFPGTKDTPASQMYLEILRKAVQADKPYHIVSRRYDIMDH